MSRSANLSPLGLFNWDNTVFDLMMLPAGLDRETLINNLLAETAELEVLYPNPVVFKNLLGIWSHKNIDVWTRLYATTQYDYNPIENYNRYEEGSQAGAASTTHSGTDTTTRVGVDTDTTNREEDGNNSENGSYHVANGGSDKVTGADTKGHWVAGYDAPTPSGEDDGLLKQSRDQDNAETVTEYGKTETGNNTTSGTYGKTEEVRHGGQHEENIGVHHGEKIESTNDGTHTLHAHGNIGVMSTQQMIEAERNIDMFNLYNIIIEDFKMRFCVLIY